MKCHESIGYAKLIWKIFCDYVQMMLTALMISQQKLIQVCCEILLGADYLKMTTIYIYSL